jgi:pimeloyl-ACP methyl ester carboxylesterase
MAFNRRRFLLSAASASIFAQVLKSKAVSADLDQKVKVRRRYTRVAGRDIFYLCAGEGPPVVLVHGSPGDSAFFLRDLPKLAARYAVYAFDTPGFGRSDPLPEPQRDVSFLADSIGDAIQGLNLPPVVVFGSHTGAAVGMELAARHPKIVRALMLDGVPIFNEEELSTWFDGFIPPLVPDRQGSHFAAVWTRCRDQSVWFPWSYKQPDHLLSQGVAPTERIQSTAMSIMRCGRTYQSAFRSAVFYAPRVSATMAKIDMPTLITCAKGDPLSAHLERMPPLKSNQSIERMPTGEEVRLLRDQWLARHAGEKSVRPNYALPPGQPELCSWMVETSSGQELFMRVAGKTDLPPLFLIHDAPGSSRMHLSLIAALSAHARVYAIDLPGCGESGPLPSAEPQMSDFVEVITAVMDVLSIRVAKVYGVGIGSSVALELAARAPARVKQLILQSVFLPTNTERAEMLANYAPPIELKADGSHWYKTWLMLRDSLVFWPWYKNNSGDRLRRIDMSSAFDADHLHDWTVELVKQYASYHHVINAAIRQEARILLGQVTDRLTLCIDHQHPFAGFDTELRAIRSNASIVEVLNADNTHVQELAHRRAI